MIKFTSAEGDRQAWVGEATGEVENVIEKHSGE
jgi:hypothetical protein